MLIGWVPAGALSVYATNRGLPETAGLTRGQRKLLALKTLSARASELAETPSKLSIYCPESWCRINLGFDADHGHFLGWYVDFQLPVTATPAGLATKDLILDMWINPDRTWEWKDRADLQVAISEGLIDPTVRVQLDREAEQIITKLDRREAPFTDQFIAFQPNPKLAMPVLPPTHGWNGTAWTLPPGWRATPAPTKPQTRPQAVPHTVSTSRSERQAALRKPHQ